MHPILVREPFDRDGWVFEEKYDGWRMIDEKDGSAVRLVSRNRTLPQTRERDPRAQSSDADPRR